METLREPSHYNEMHEARKSRVSWPAIFGGTLIMLVTMMLLSLLGVGIGTGSINPMEEAQPLKGIGTGTLIWWIISNLMAIFAGAFTAAKLTNVNYKFSGFLHGILTWSLYALISFVLVTGSIGVIISGVGSGISKSLSAFGMGASEIASLAEGVNTDRINRLIQVALTEDQEDKTKRQEFKIDLLAVVQEVFIEGGEINTNLKRDEVVQSIARNSSLSRQEADRAADIIIREYEQIEQQLKRLAQKAEETAQEVAEGVSKATIWSFVALLLGVITAAIGGSLGKPNVVTVHDHTITI